LTFIIAGFGKFGRLALERLTHAFPEETLILLDHDPHAFSGGRHTGNVREIVTDAVKYLVEHRDDLGGSETWITPTAPLHLFAGVALGVVSDLRLAALPPTLPSLVPNPYQLDGSTICCSYADFVCPDDCEEGPLCTVTGESRQPLYSRLKGLVLPGYNVQILVSRQLCPGIGGYTSQDLFQCISEIQQGCTVIGTSCRCHAILTAVTRGNRMEAMGGPEAKAGI
jgi:hypothetical protein